jgi:hypothetical protein
MCGENVGASTPSKCGGRSQQVSAGLTQTAHDSGSGGWNLTTTASMGLPLKPVSNAPAVVGKSELMVVPVRYLRPSASILKS